MNQDDKDQIERLRASKLKSQTVMKQQGMEAADFWCRNVAEYDQIRRLSLLRKQVGPEDYASIQDDGTMFMVIAQAALGKRQTTIEQDEAFWTDSVHASSFEVHDQNYLEGFLEGCERFWKDVASKA